MIKHIFAVDFLLAGLLLALTFDITAPIATVIAAIILALSSVWQTYTLNKVHSLVNSNFTEAKAARLAAEAALKTSQDLNVHLQQQLDLKTISALAAQLPLASASSENDK